jgi:hypothetical protein
MQDNAASSMSQELRDHQLTIRIPQRIRDALDAQAEAERRTVAAVLNNILAKLYPIPTTAKSHR